MNYAYIISSSLVIVASAIIICTYRKENERLNKEIYSIRARTEADLQTLRDAYRKLKTDLPAERIPNGCKRGEWCKACIHRIEKRNILNDCSVDSYIICGKGSCKEFSSK